MGLVANTAGFVRYAVSGTMPADFWNFAGQRIAEFSFRDIDDGFEEKSIGWVSVYDMFDSSFAYAAYSAGDNLVLSLRVDERKVAPAVLKKMCMKEENRIKREKQLPRLNRAHRQEIKENIRLQLLKRAIPTPAVYDLCWNLADATLLFFSNNKKAQELLEQLFKDTFAMQLTLLVPYLTAGHLLDETRQDALADLRPEIFI